ncbi:DUF7482 domain-containing protein [Nitrososphaera viennensis]|uniref:DUF7482 domain-containing protein n=2 Tax=Nitrososphaera viennensis TaxID=1034015 RepID=A0A060HPN2_9ARCH|nr:hypothetical protein [Nitrososphaera viennensis]AIC15506.1 hypothetical protein NVIE_012720 [Nitrososphaera viennensis EN76]UVS70393.1 hypothetical protein NWT39_06305 [Nitrososphaera viennensis]
MVSSKTKKGVVASAIAASILITAVVVVLSAPLASRQQETATTALQQQQTGNPTDNTTTTAADNKSVSAASNATVADKAGSVLKLSRASVPIDIPLEKGYHDGKDLFFIATDVSDQDVAAQLTNESGFQVNFAPLLAKTPQDARNQAYFFTNGIEGNGTFGFQLPVVTSKPGDGDYSPLWQVNMASWKETATPRELTSVQQVMDAQNSGQLDIMATDIIVNHPAIKWDGGSLKIRDDRNSITDDSSYVGGQILGIDTEKMLVTMVAHRGWRPDGKTIYYVVTDATPEMPATMMGVASVPAEEKLARTPVAVDLFQFENGIKGSGPMGFQAGIGGANPDDSTKYSPMWKISFIKWKDPSQARVLENLGDINAMVAGDSITLAPAMEGKHVVNCPFFSEETVSRHMHKEG